MKICKPALFSFIFLFSLQTIFAQKIRISGEGPGYANALLKLYLETDPVTKSLLPLQKLHADSTGHFSSEVDLVPPATLVIKTGIYSLNLFVEKAGDIDISLPARKEKNADEEQNSFFAEAKLIPEIRNDRGSVNNLMRKFDSVYNDVFNRVADRIMYNTKKEDIPALKEKLNSVDVPGAPEFFSDFVRYRLIMLNQVANGEHRGRKEDSLIINTKYTPWNIGYSDLIEQMFAKYFREIASGRYSEKFMAAVRSRSVDNLLKIIRDDGRATNPSLAEYVAILNLFNEYSGSLILQGDIDSLLQNLSLTASSQYNKDLAAKVYARLTSLEKGRVPPPVSLRDDTGALFSLNNLRGKFILVSFGRSDNAFTLSEYGILSTWAGKYKDQLKVVTILRDDDFRSGTARMSSMGFKWLMLDGSSADLQEYLYEVVIYPSFILIDRQGHILMRNCPFPSENLDQRMSEIIENEVKSSAPQN